MGFPYSIPHERALTNEERTLLARLISDFDAELGSTRGAEISSLRIFARCGCGKCPTIMFEREPDKKQMPKSLIGDHFGIGTNGEKIGIHLWERDSVIVELEAWSIEGGDIERWPAIETVRPLRELA